METATDETEQTPGTSSHYQKHIPPSPKTVLFLDLSNTKFYLIMRSLNPPCAYILKTKLKLMKTSSTTSDTWRRPLQCRKYSDKRCFYWFLQINVSMPPILRDKMEFYTFKLKRLDLEEGAELRCRKRHYLCGGKPEDAVKRLREDIAMFPGQVNNSLLILQWHKSSKQDTNWPPSGHEFWG